MFSLIYSRTYSNIYALAVNFSDIKEQFGYGSSRCRNR